MRLKGWKLCGRIMAMCKELLYLITLNAPSSLKILQVYVLHRVQRAPNKTESTPEIRALGDPR